MKKMLDKISFHKHFNITNIATITTTITNNPFKHLPLHLDMDADEVVNGFFDELVGED